MSTEAKLYRFREGNQGGTILLMKISFMQWIPASDFHGLALAILSLEDSCNSLTFNANDHPHAQKL